MEPITNYWSALAQGVLASLIAVTLVELYRLGKRALGRRKQKTVWMIKGHTLEVVVPIFRKYKPAGTELDLRGGLIGTYDSIGISHLLSAGSRIGLETNLLPYDQLPPRGFLQGVSVGGPVSNRFTADLLDQFCPGFRPILIDPSKPYLSTGEEFNFNGWTCGEKSLVDSRSLGYGFLVRLTPAITHLDSTIHLCFGMTDMGTAASLYYLAENNIRLVSYKSRPYFIAFTVQLENGFRAISNQREDLSTAAFDVTP